ncbi:MAG TPA: adenylate/guanylate cyclase domain-containing protein [Sphingomicrobium sp.]|nr:adenylate/guanylate cyclase domain-containing protein [Sphingomicrobium sp.]
MDGVQAWLKGLGLEQYAPAFRDNAIGAELLAKLTAEDLKEIGVAALGHRKKLLDAIAGLAAQSPAPSILSAAERPREAERRQLTVMFVDLVESTALATQLDPEEMQDILKAYQNTAAGDITRYEGHVAKFMGDGILAYFGWPRAHEDEAERAARAALAVVDSIGKLKTPEGKPLACRIGIATGLVVVGELVGEGAAREETVVGETPNLAARLQQRAPPGAVVVSAATRRLLEGLFEFQVLNAQVLKGISGSVQVSQLLRPTAVESRFEARRAKGVLPLIGREQELALLLDRWEQARTSEGQVVLLLGEAGIGKSRIALAVRKRVRQEPSTILRYHGSPYYTQTALKPVIEQFARAAGFERDDSHSLRLDKLEALLAHAGQDPKTSTPVLAALLGLPGDGRYLPLDMTPPVLRARTFELLLAQLVGLARQQPVLVIVIGR